MPGLDSSGVPSQGFVHARQALYPPNCIPSFNSEHFKGFTLAIPLAFGGASHLTIFLKSKSSERSVKFCVFVSMSVFM